MNIPVKTPEERIAELRGWVIPVSVKKMRDLFKERPIL